jgi:putative ATP-binding cassette transporter
MKLIDFYTKESTVSATPIIISAVISGIANGSLLAIINQAAESASYDSLNVRYFLLFAIAMAIFVGTKKFALKRSTILAENVIKQIRIRITDKIRHSRLLFLEELGKPEIYTRLTQDTNLISQSGIVIMNACQSAVMIFFASIYIAILSKIAFFIALFSIGCAVVIYLSNLKEIHKDLHESTNKETEFFDSLNDILDGFKEIKINKAKSDDLFDYFKDIGHSTEALKVNVGVKFVKNIIFANSFFYILMAVIVFLLPTLTPTYTDVIIKTTAAILFIIGPLGGVVEAIPFFSRANVAIENLYQLEDGLDTAGKDVYEVVEKREHFNEIQLDNVLFSYKDKAGTPLFTVGSIDLSIKRGEILFLVGGNGSGKSTVLKLLTGLYYPLSGIIKLDDREVTTIYPTYRELFSIIFTDFHLFNRLYGIKEVDIQKMNRLLTVTELDKKTKFIDGKFTNINLSTGQRKRLALIVALLEDKPIYVFDEVAADQDPNFKKYFYEEMLKDLKNQGKTIIIVSHDDRYFHVADRILKMEYGKFVKSKI